MTTATIRIDGKPTRVKVEDGHCVVPIPGTNSTVRVPFDGRRHMVSGTVSRPIVTPVAPAQADGSHEGDEVEAGGNVTLRRSDFDGQDPGRVGLTVTGPASL